MKKTISAICSLLFFVLSINAMDFVTGGDNAFRLVHPDLLTGAASSAGGAFYYSGPGTISVNPAITAAEQRIMLNLGYTTLLKITDSTSVGGAAQLALLVPSKWGVFSGTFQGVFCEVGQLQLGNTIGLRAGFSKDITESLYAGIALNGGIRWYEETDWSLGLDLGFVYTIGKLGFLQNTRIGCAITNLGKPYDWGYSSIGNPRIGIAATLFSIANDNVAGGFSTDLSFPQFMNIALDTGFQVLIANIITIKTAWQFNLRETLSENYNLMPSIGITVKFKINTKNNEFMANKGWQQSEITTSGAWQQVYDGIQAISAGAAINLGMKDIEAPKIVLWGEE